VVAYVGGLEDPLTESNPVLRVVAPVFAVALGVELSIAILASGLKAIDTEGAEVAAGFGSPAQIGELFLTKFLVPFEVVSLLLLIAAVGAVVLARKSQPTDEVR
jgi:NADH-quinone oxidoreductase subunit J